MKRIAAFAARCAGGAALFYLWLGARGDLEPTTPEL